MYEKKLALKCWYLSTPCMVLCACHMLINLFYLICIYACTCRGNLFLLRDKTEKKKLKRKAFLHNRYLNIIFALLLMVCIYRPPTQERFILSSVPWSSHLLCMKYERLSIWFWLQFLSAMLLSQNFSFNNLWGFSSLYFLFFGFFLCFFFLLFVSLFLLIMSSPAKKINSLLFMVPLV